MRSVKQQRGRMLHLSEMAGTGEGRTNYRTDAGNSKLDSSQYDCMHLKSFPPKRRK